MASSTPLEAKSSTNQLEWEEYVMAIAYLAAKRSKDPKTRVGACIVNEDKRIIGIGYNAMPRGCSDDKFPWEKNKYDRLNCKLSYVTHAELNAIIHKNVSDKNCTLYVTFFPCQECAKLIIQSGIKKVVYGFKKSGAKTKKRVHMLESAGVELQEYTPKQQKIVIDFTEIDRIEHEKRTGTSKRMSENTDVEAKKYVPKRKRDQINFTEREEIQQPSTSLEKDPHE